MLITADFSDRLLQINPSILSLSEASADVAICKKRKIKKKTDESLNSFNFYHTFFACFFRNSQFTLFGFILRLKVVINFENYVWPIRNVSKLYDLIQENISEKFDYQILTWMKENLGGKDQIVKFIYSEKASKFCEISTNYLTGSTWGKLVEISQNFMAFSEYMNFN